MLVGGEEGRWEGGWEGAGRRVEREVVGMENECVNFSCVEIHKRQVLICFKKRTQDMHAHQRDSM